MTQSRRTRAALARDWLVRHPYVLPISLLAVGAAFRFYNLNWDNGHQLHPDERWIYMVVSGANNNPPLSWPTSISQFLDVRDQGGSPLNPHFFAYGSLPFYLLAFLAGFLSIVGQHVPFLSAWAPLDSYPNLPTLGRALSGVLDLLSVLLIFFLGRRIYGYWTGILAMALCAFTVLDIQLSHFYAVDTVLLPLCLLTLLAAVHIVQTDSRGPYIWGGIALGAAMATKTTALLLVIPLGVAPLLAAWSTSRWPSRGPVKQRVLSHYRAVARLLNRNLQWTLATYMIGAFSFSVLEPYALLDRTTLLKNIAEQTTYLVTNDPPFAVPFTIQYANTIPYVYQIKNLLFWCMGIPLALTAFAGVLWALIRLVQPRLRSEQIILLAWVIPYFLFVGRFFAKFDRYMLPITPVMTLLGAALLVWLVQRARGKRRLLATAALVVVTGVSFLYSLAYMNIYEHPNTRVAASLWIYAHIPKGTHFAIEGPWDDPLPLDEGGQLGSATYPQPTSLDLYAGEGTLQDTDHKIANITDVLTHSQYIVMSSERLIGSIPKVPDLLPVGTRYYQLLMGGKLNFKLEYLGQEHPQLGPIVVHDYPADESFHVYDHPIVRIFKRDGPISPGRVRALLTTGLKPADPTADPASLPEILRPAVPAPDARLMLSKSKWQADQQGQTFAQMFPPDGFAMKHPTLVWWLALEILGLLVFPFTFLLLSNLIDRGFVVAKTFGLLITGYVIWIAVSLGLATFERGLIVLVLLLLACASGLLAYRLRRELAAFIRTRWKYVAAGEAVFLAGFIFVVLLRMWYPDLGHQFSPVAPSNVGEGRMGEKQMELAFLNAVIRSRVFPPYDPFFAHGYINYYYYGFFLVASLCKLTQIAPSIGFNLAIATFFALLVANVFSALLTLTRRMTPGILGALMVGVLGNLNGAWQLIRGLMSIAAVSSSVPFYGGVIDVLSGLRQMVFAGATLPPFDYWESRSILPSGGINEFPYFTYLFADLHPHLMAYPMTAAVLVLAVHVVRGPRAGFLHIALSVALGAILLGAIAVTNPWDFPTYLALLGLAALIAAYVARRTISPGMIIRPAVWLAALSLLSVLLYLPFKQGYMTVFHTGLGFVRNETPLVLQQSGICGDGSSSCPGLIRDTLVTPFTLYFEHFGLFLFIAAWFLFLLIATDLGLGARVRRTVLLAQFLMYYRDRLPRVRHARRVARRMQRERPSDFDMSAVWGTLVLVVGLMALRYFLLAALVALLGAISIVVVYLGRRLSAAQLLVLAMLGLGLTISALTQIVYVKDFLDNSGSFRMNTLFKFYMQAWLLYAVASAACLYFVMQRLVPARGRQVADTNPRRTRALRLLRSPEAGTTAPQQALVAVAVPLPLQMYSASDVPIAGSSLPRTEDEGHQDDEPVTRRPRRFPAAAARWSSSLDRPLRLFTGHPIWSSLVGLLVLASLIYTYAGTVSRETYRTTWLAENSVPYTLDGMAFMKVAYPHEYDAITWLNGHARGAQVIAESANAGYNWRSRVSMFTGLPTIINGIHEPEQRFQDEIDPTALCGQARNPAACDAQFHPRADDLNALYDSTDVATARRIIRRYGVSYIYVGFSERQCTKDQCFSRAGLAKFDHMVGRGLRVAYRNPGVTIYLVSSA